MTRIIAAFLFSLIASLAQAQVPNGGGPMVPNAAPGAQANLNAAVDPTVSNDSTQGYQIGSLWQNATTGRIWMARSVSVGAAVWTLLEFSDHPGYIVSNWYVPVGVQIGNFAGANPGANSIRMLPAFIKERITLNALGVRVATLSAGGNVQAAIYANNPATGRPQGSPLASTASMPTASVASVNAAVSVQLEPGIYWFATCMDNATATLVTMVNTSTGPLSATIGSATQSNDLGGGGFTGLSVAGTFGTWPNMTGQTFTELNNSSATGIVQFEVGSVP